MSQKTIDIAKTIGGGYNRFWHNKNSYRAVIGSRGSKNSKMTAVNIVYRMMRWANTHLVRRISNALKQSAYTELKWAINKLGVAHLWKTNEGLPELTYIRLGKR